jgi:predicted nucleotide-binding protein
MEISRRVRKFRDVASLRDYLEVVDDARAVENRTDAEAVQEARAAVVGVSADDENVVDPRRVFVVHGRDLQAKAAVYQFLRDIDLHPLDWEELVAATGVAAPYIGDTVAAAFRIAQAVVVLLTPDDDARLHPSLRGATEAAHEVNLAGQARPNVLFEAGMALASHPDRTVLVEIGQLRPFSDVAGRHTVRLDGNASTLNALATRLQSAGCAVNLSGSDWLNVVPFMDLDAHTRRPAEEPHQG